MYIDSVRVYQSKNDSAHVGTPHHVGCDPAEFPTKEFIAGHRDRYMRGAPFSVSDKGPLKKNIKHGGGACYKNSDCGGVDSPNEEETESSALSGKGHCISKDFSKGMFSGTIRESKCECHEGYTGPHCLVGKHGDGYPGVWETRTGNRVFRNIASPEIPTTFMSVLLILLTTILVPML